MKKILVAVVALVMTSAFAHDGEHRHMITFDGLESDNVNDRSFDLSTSNGEDSTRGNVALNYTFAINGEWMVGGMYQNNGVATTTGVHAFYNLDGRTHDTCYVGLHYKMSDMRLPEGANEVEMNTISLEYGHRFSLGMWKGLHLQFSPSVSYNMNTTKVETQDDVEDSAIAWNWIKFDLLF